MIYFAPDAWDGPLSLFDMMEVKDPRIFSFIDNYHVRLIAGLGFLIWGIELNKV